MEACRNKHASFFTKLKLYSNNVISNNKQINLNIKRSHTTIKLHRPAISTFVIFTAS